MAQLCVQNKTSCHISHKQLLEPESKNNNYTIINNYQFQHHL